MTTKTKESYSSEFKENAVKRATESNNIAQTARELGIKENTLYNWVHKYTRSVEPAKVTRSDELSNGVENFPVKSVEKFPVIVQAYCFSAAFFRCLNR